MATVIKIPTWATFNKFPAGSPAQGLAILGAVFQTTFNVGDTNPVWNDLQDLDLGGGPLTRAATLDGLAEVTPMSNLSFLTSSQIQLAVAVGGDVIGCPLWFKVAEADYTNEVPAALPNRTYESQVLDEEQAPVLDENGDPIFETIVKTWAEWDDVSHAGPWGGYYYVPSSAGTRYLLDASVVVVTGVSFVTQPEYAVVAAENASPSE